MGTELEGRRVLVTGASSGIGRATVRACAAAGARVALLARRFDRVAALAAEVSGAPIAADLRDPIAAAAAVDEAASHLGGLDAVVNNAGVARTGSIADGDVEEWRAMLETNVLGLLAVTRAAIPHLRTAGRGDVVNVSSMSGRRVPGARSAVYSGTKHAVHAISAALRRELHPDGIRVSIVSPGFVRTDIDGAGGETIPDYALDDVDVARAIVHVLGAPTNVNVLEYAVLSTSQET
jgi:NADP-dependent 3-hydroxy acid dehydrogenase YdfG